MGRERIKEIRSLKKRAARVKQRFADDHLKRVKRLHLVDNGCSF